MTRRQRARILLALAAPLLLAGACVRPRTAHPGVQETLYRDGLRAFHLGTPEGYRRAAVAFRQAAAIETRNCDYALNLAQALLFLSHEQRLNWEDYGAARREALAVSSTAACPDHEAFRRRLAALAEYPAESALEAIDDAVRIDAGDPMNWVVHWKLRGPTGTSAGMEHPEELDPESALVQYEAGQVYLRRGEPERASAAFGRAVALNPAHYRSYLALGHLKFEAESADAESLYGEVVRLAPEFLEGRLALGQYYAASDQNEAAIEQYRAAIDTNPDFHPAHFSLGTLLLDLERPDAAEPHFREVVRLDQSNADAYYYLGNIQYGRERYSWAQIQYELALAWEPSHVNAEYGYGKAAQELGDLDEALRRFERVVEIAPNFPDGYFSRGSVRSLREEYPDAVADYAMTTLMGEREVLQTDSRIRDAARRSTRLAEAERRRLEEYKGHLEELLSYAVQNRAAVETYLRQVEAFERSQRRVSEQ